MTTGPRTSPTREGKEDGTAVRSSDGVIDRAFVGGVDGAIEGFIGGAGRGADGNDDGSFDDSRVVTVGDDKGFLVG